MHKDDARDEAAAQTRQIDRRTIAKGVAWTVPVVIVATAAPAAAASGGVTITASRSSGNLVVTFVNDGASPVRVIIEAITPGSGWAVPTAAQNVPQQKSRTFTLTDTSSGAQYLTISYSVDGASYSTAVYPT